MDVNRCQYGPEHKESNHVEFHKRIGGLEAWRVLHILFFVMIHNMIEQPS